MTVPAEVPRPPKDHGCEVCHSRQTVLMSGRHGRRCSAHPPLLDAETVDPLAAFVLARAWHAWWINERFATAAASLTRTDTTGDER